MNFDVSGLSIASQKIFKLLTEKTNDKNEFVSINKGLFDNISLENFSLL
jgi:hypothetical protein